MLEKQTAQLLEDLRGFSAKKVSDEQARKLEEISRHCRLDTVLMTGIAGSGHPAGSMSSMDIFNILLATMDLTPGNCNHPSRDKVVVSHGHTSPGVYAALAAWGFIERDAVLPNFRRAGSPFQGHIEREVNGIDWGTGNLGQGLSAAVGFALAARAQGTGSRVFTVMGDGEQPKGQNAEARRIASKEKLSSITVLIDANDIQISGNLEDVMPVDIGALWRADGWHVIECCGHDYRALYRALKKAVAHPLPTVIICLTLMGRGVDFMEDTPEYHGKAAAGEALSRAVVQLGGDPAEIDRLRQLSKGPLPLLPERPVCPISIDTGQPHTYEAGDKSDNRGAFGNALADVAGINYGVAGRTPIVAFDCDLAGSVKLDKFAKLCPDRFIQAGIQEHATAAVAGAASTSGVISVWAEFGVFGVDEVYNQQRLNDINAAPLKTVLTHVGLDVGEDGKTHQCIDYVGLPRNMFGWKVIVPADPNQTDRATRWMLAHQGSVCLAVGRSTAPVILREDGTPFFAGDYVFEYGAIDELRSGKDAVILSMGRMAATAIEAADVLAGEGVSVSVLHVACPLGLCADALLAAIADRPLVTIEDHHVDTGLGSIAALMAGRAGRALRMKNLGVASYGESGLAKELFARSGLDAAGVADALRSLL